VQDGNVKLEQDTKYSYSACSFYDKNGFPHNSKLGSRRLRNLDESLMNDSQINDPTTVYMLSLPGRPSLSWRLADGAYSSRFVDDAEDGEELCGCGLYG
jgi:hypothetical protein